MQSNAALLLLLDKDAVAPLLSPPAVLEAVRKSFLLHSDGTGRNYPIIREPLAGKGVFGIKSGDVLNRNLLGLKAAGFWPGNKKSGGEPHQATIVLFSPDTGRPLCIIDGNAITTHRTGAAGGLGLMLLANRQSSSLCIFGTGVQARIQVQYALDLLPSLHTVRYVSASGETVPDFEAIFTGRCTITHMRDGNEAVSQSDIVVTATPGRGPLFNSSAVMPGTHLNCVGTDTKGKRELPEGLLKRTTVFVDDREQSISIGELQWDHDVPASELGDLIGGKMSFQRRPDDITIFDMTGLSLQDVVVADMVFKAAQAQVMGTSLPWPW